MGDQLHADPGRRPSVSSAFTGANIGNRLAVVLDNQIRSVATIQSRISDRAGSPTWAAKQEASDLALVLRSGSLPAGIVYLEERSVGPSLGADSIREGIMAGLAGLVAVIVVMLVYYKRAGVNAVLALFLNTVILMAALSYFKAVLTLPGIAGVILTIGMAVDSQRPDFRAHSRGTAGRQGHRLGGGCGIWQGLVDHRRHPRHHHGFLRFPVSCSGPARCTALR